MAVQGAVSRNSDFISRDLSYGEPGTVYEMHEPSHPSSTSVRIRLILYGVLYVLDSFALVLESTVFRCHGGFPSRDKSVT